MAGLSPEDVPKILTKISWEPRGVGERTWRITLHGSVGTIRVVVRYAGAWLYLSVLPFFDPGTIKPWGAGKFPVGFLGRLLAVNRHLALVRFALDDDGDVVLRTELPTESLQESELITAAQTIVRTTEQYRQPVRDALHEAARVAEVAGTLDD